MGIPISPRRGRRAGMNNSLTRARLKPVLMSGGYAQFTYSFNYWGPTGVNRDTFVYVRRIDTPELLVPLVSRFSRVKTVGSVLIFLGGKKKFPLGNFLFSSGSRERLLGLLICCRDFW